jgi:hypothetical protein
MQLAGFDIVRRPRPLKAVTRYTHPRCGYSAIRGQLQNVLADRGEASNKSRLPSIDDIR